MVPLEANHWLVVERNTAGKNVANVPKFAAKGKSPGRPYWIVVGLQVFESQMYQ
jgi:hypothetical protein